MAPPKEGSPQLSILSIFSNRTLSSMDTRSISSCSNSSRLEISSCSSFCVSFVSISSMAYTGMIRFRAKAYVFSGLMKKDIRKVISVGVQWSENCVNLF